jgi:hypothetical protein
LNNLGVSKHQSSRYQQVARVPEETFESYIASKKDRGEEITTNRLLRLGREMVADERRATRAAAAVTAGRPCQAPVSVRFRSPLRSSPLLRKTRCFQALRRP